MNRFVCVIDPGHGGYDPGATFDNLKESEVNLKVALSLRARILQSWSGINPILTRETDEFMSLGKRCRISNDYGARFFLCIHCNAKDTDILMADGTIKKIQDVLKGDYIADSTGMPSRVKNVFSRYYSGDLNSFSAYKSNIPLTVTPEHPILINSGKSFRYLKSQDVLPQHRLTIPILNFTHPQKNYDVVNCFQSKYYYEIEDNSIKAKRSLFMKTSPKKPFKRFLDFDDNFLWLIGLFCADGSATIDHYSNVSFGLNAKKDISKTKRLIEILKSFGLEPLTRTERGCAVTYVISNIFANLMKHFVPGDCYTKQINQDLMFLPLEQQKNLLEGWLAGDGTFYEDRYKGDSVSNNLASQMFQIAMRCNLHPSFSKLKHHSGYGSSVKHAYRLIFSANDKNGLPPKANVFFTEHPFRICPELKKIEHLPYSGEVYNLETETNSYTANNFAVHNCNADPDEDSPGMSEAKGEEIWYCTGSPKGKLYAQTISTTINKVFPDEPFRGIKESHTLYVLNHTIAPANLVELGFIDNSNTNRKFRDPNVIQDIAKCLYESIQLIVQLQK